MGPISMAFARTCAPFSSRGDTVSKPLRHMYQTQARGSHLARNVLIIGPSDHNFIYIVH